MRIKQSFMGFFGHYNAVTQLSATARESTGQQSTFLMIFFMIVVREYYVKKTAHLETFMVNV